MLVGLKKDLQVNEIELTVSIKKGELFSPSLTLIIEMVGDWIFTFAVISSGWGITLLVSFHVARSLVLLLILFSGAWDKREICSPACNFLLTCLGAGLQEGGWYFVEVHS